MPELFFDNRGYVGSVFRQDNKYQYAYNFVEDRCSVSKYGTVRGFHGDSKTWKWATCLYGELYLIIYDLINHSKKNCILSAKNGNSILIPPNTLNAHQCLSDNCLLFYKWDRYYALDKQWSVRYNDSSIAPDWPVEVTEVSERDQNSPLLEEFLTGFRGRNG